MNCGKSDLQKHALGKKHKANLQTIKSSTNIESAFKNVKPDQNVAVKEAEIRLESFFAEHNVAFVVADHLIQVIKKSFKDSDIAKNVTLNRTKCTNIIKNILSTVETDETISNLKICKFSILVDESTDITDTKFMCTLVRYVSPVNGHIRTALLELISLDARNCSAVHIYDAFKNCLTSKNIPLSNIVGVASDGANVMVGRTNSFYSHLKNDVPSIILMQCICHSSALIAGKACEKLPRGPEDLLRNISSYCSGSAKRCAQLCEMQDFFHVERKKILKLASTRWLSMHQCVARVLENWTVLMHYFRIAVVEDKLHMAETILKAMENHFTKAYLLFLKYVLNIMNLFNALFQSKTVLIHKITEASENILKDFCSNFIKLDVLSNSDITNIDVTDPNNFLPSKSINLGMDCNEYIKHFSPVNYEQIKNICLEFYTSAALEIKKRLPIKNIIFQQLRFLDPKLALYGNSQNNLDIDFKILTEKLNDLNDLNLIETEWRRLKILINNNDKTKLSSLPIDEFWHTVSKLKDYSDTYQYQNISRLAKICLSLPHSNAEAERIFSVVTDVKTKKRNRLGDDTLNSVAVIRSATGAKEINCLNFEVTEKHLKLHNSNNLYKQ